jgi:hypothetical protein
MCGNGTRGAEQLSVRSVDPERTEAAVPLCGSGDVARPREIERDPPGRAVSVMSDRGRHEPPTGAVLGDRLAVAHERLPLPWRHRTRRGGDDQATVSDSKPNDRGAGRVARIAPPGAGGARTLRNVERRLVGVVYPGRSLVVVVGAEVIDEPGDDVWSKFNVFILESPETEKASG